MNSWVEMIPLGELGKIVSGSTPRTDNNKNWGGDIPWITPANLTNHDGIFFRGELRKITNSGYESCSTTMLPIGSILFSSRAPIGHCAVTSYPLCTNQGFKSIIPNERLDPIYGFFALKFFTPQIISRGRGATFAEINKEIFSTFKIPVPPLSEQKCIAAILEKADRLRRLRQYARKLSDTFLQSVFLEMFGDPVTNPKGWRELSIEEIAAKEKYALKRGPFGGSLKKEIFVEKGFKVYEQQHAITKDFSIGSYYIDEDKYQSMIAFKLDPGDFIISCSGTVGQIARVPINAEPGIINQALLKIKFNSSILTPEYFEVLFETDSIQAELFEVTRGSGIRNFPPMTTIRAFQIPVPPMNIQERFTRVVTRYNTLKEKQSEGSRQAEYLFQSLLHRAFRGEM